MNAPTLRIPAVLVRILAAAASVLVAAGAQNQRDSYSRNQQEAGRQLMGNSTFTAANGAQTVLPHTWQANTTHQHQGNTYHVDPSGQYWVQATNGYWYPLKK